MKQFLNSFIHIIAHGEVKTINHSVGHTQTTVCALSTALHESALETKDRLLTKRRAYNVRRRRKKKYIFIKS